MWSVTERIVLVTVFDVRDSVAVEKPWVELNARKEVITRKVRRLRRANIRKERRAKIVFHCIPMKFDVVIAMNERERVSFRDEFAQSREYVVVALNHPRKLEARVIAGIAEAMATLFVSQRRLERIRFMRRDRHADKVDKVARDDDTPPFRWWLLSAIVRKKTHKITVDRD